MSTEQSTTSNPTSNPIANPVANTTLPRETLQGDRLCMQCLHPLRGRAIERDAGTGLLYVLITERTTNRSARIAVGAGLAASLLAVWAELAVGIF